MKLLVIGGTRFLGRAIAQQAVAAGHDVTTFNRGKTAPDVPGVLAVRGDRDDPDDLTMLAAGRSWDAVIDTSGYAPRAVAASARALAGHADRYLYLSAASVYQGGRTAPGTEDWAVPGFPTATDMDRSESRTDCYARRNWRLKVACERAVSDIFPGMSIMLRPTAVLGPREYCGHLLWWLRRMQRGGEVLSPGDPARPIQPVDVLDAAALAITIASSKLTGAFNIAAPAGSATYGDLLAACRQATGSEAILTWVSDQFLLRHGVRPAEQIPLWRAHPSIPTVSTSRARTAGLGCRPIADTVRRTWEWMASSGPMTGWPCRDEIGLDAAKEQAVLSAWRRTGDAPLNLRLLADHDPGRAGQRAEGAAGDLQCRTDDRCRAHRQ